MSTKNYDTISRRVFFVLLDIENAPLRATDAQQPLYWDEGLGGEDYIWLGAGAISDVSGLGANTQMSVESVSLTCNMVNQNPKAILDENEYLGRTVKIWQCDLNEVNRVVRPVLRFKGFMDSAGVRVGKSSVITMNCKNGHATWNQRGFERINHEQHQAEHPGDMGLEFVSVLVSTVLQS